MPKLVKVYITQCLIGFAISALFAALLLGLDRRAAAEFSFFLAMPTMLGAFTYDLAKNYKNLTMDDGVLVVVGFVAAFCAALIGLYLTR